MIMDLVGGLGLRLLLALLRWVGLGSRLGVLDAKGLSVQCTSNFSTVLLAHSRLDEDRCER